MKQVKLNIDGKIVTFNRVEGGRRKPDPAEKATEKALKSLDSKLRNVYQTAADDLFMKQQSWLDAHLKRAEKYQKQVEAGLITQQDYEAWMQGQLFQEKAWALKRGQLARTMAEADQRAMEMINEGKLEVFAENANYMLFGVEQNTGATAAFGLYDRNAVLRLVKDEPNLLPMPKIDEEKDYAWYNRIIGNAVTQGIIQGESLDKICLRVAEESGERGLNALRRNARTAYTGAQNAGRVEGMKRARDEMGIRVKKRWMSTLDEKTRDSHQELDGKTAEIDEPFDSLLGPIMYPGDPGAEPGNVYNCRCTLTYVYPKYNTAAVNRADGETGESVGQVTYKEWKEQKAREGKEPEPQKAKPPENIKHFDFTPAKTIDEAEAYARQFLQSQEKGTVSFKGIDLEFANTENRVLNDVFSQYGPKYKLDKIAPMNRREKIFKSVIETSDACYHWGGNGGMYINPNFYKSQGTLNAHKAEIDKLMGICLDGGQSLLDSGKYAGAKRTYVEALLSTGRQCVSQSYDFVEGTIVHESGHMLDDKLFRKTMREIESPLAKMGAIDESRHKYGGGISGYAATSNPEYIAESFTAWWYGETGKVDPELARVFEEAKSIHG